MDVEVLRHEANTIRTTEFAVRASQLLDIWVSLPSWSWHWSLSRTFPFRRGPRFCAYGRASTPCGNRFHGLVRHTVWSVLLCGGTHRSQNTLNERMEDTAVTETPRVFACPCCNGLLGALEEAPVLFSPCGHTVCPACADAVGLCTTDDGPLCPVCDTPIRETGRNPEVTIAANAWTVAAARVRVDPPPDVVATTLGGDGGLEEGGVPCGDLELVQCQRHPNQYVYYVCRVSGTPLCMACISDIDHEVQCCTSHWGNLRPFVEGVEPALEVLLDEFESSVRRSGHAEVAATAGVAAVIAAGEVAAEQTKKMFASLRKQLDAREASLSQEVRAETRRRTKVLETQAAELSVTAAQAQAVVRVGRTALSGADPVAIARAHKLAFTSRGLLDPHLALKASPSLALQLDVPQVQRLLEAALVAADDDPAHECALACHTFSQRAPHNSDDELAHLLQMCAPHLSSPATGVAVCRAVATHLGFHPLHKGGRHDKTLVHDTIGRVMPPVGCVDTQWCELWCGGCGARGRLPTQCDA